MEEDMDGVAMCGPSEPVPPPGDTPAPVGLSPPSSTIEPTASPVDYPDLEDCPYDDVALRTTIGEKTLPAGELPIKVVARDVEAGTVTVQISNTYSEVIDHMYIQYYDGNREEECVKYEKVQTTTVIDITAMCMASTPHTVMGIWLQDEDYPLSNDHAQIPPCCHSPGRNSSPVVHYSFDILCECPADEVARKFLRN